MKTCDYVKELLPLYIDNGLDKDELKLVEDHALVCEECQSELELYKGIQDALLLDDIDLPENFHHDLLNKLQLQNETDGINVFHKSFFSKYTKYANLAAIFALVMFLSIIGLSKYNIWDEFSLGSQKTSSTMETTTEETKAETMEAPQISMVAPQEAMEATTEVSQESAAENVLPDDAKTNQPSAKASIIQEDTTAATERTTNDSLLVESKADESTLTLAVPQSEDAGTNDIAETESTYGSEATGEADSETLNYGFFILLTILTLGGSISLVWMFFKHRK